jgi:hypothetical protein
MFHLGKSMLELAFSALGNVALYAKTLATTSNRTTNASAHPRIDDFGHRFISSAREWKPNERVLDVGAGYSPLISEMVSAHSIEGWAADDFGASRGDTYWLRNKDQSIVEVLNKEVRFVRECVGLPDQCTLPLNYFDAIYSKVGMHYAARLHTQEWAHMAALLSQQPGSEIIVVMGQFYPTHGAPERAFDALDAIVEAENKTMRLMSKGPVPLSYWEALAADLGPPHHLSAWLYVASLYSILALAGELIAPHLRLEAMLSRADIVPDPWYNGLLNMRYTGLREEGEKFGFGRYTSLTLRVRRL